MSLCDKVKWVSEDTMYIVDWDLPVGNSRRGFYRELARLRNKLGLHGSMSSMSVLITKDKDFAHQVYEIARRYARVVHMYVGRQIR